MHAERSPAMTFVKTQQSTRLPVFCAGPPGGDGCRFEPGRDGDRLGRCRLCAVEIRAWPPGSLTRARDVMA